MATSSSGQTNSTTYSSDKFPNPFFDIASEYIPNDIVTILDWCDFLWLTMGTYRSAARRVVRYFLTEVILDGESDTERESFKKFLDDDLHLLVQLADIGDEFMTYGNVFISLYFPFKRMLICPKCKTEYSDKFLKYKFTGKGEFTASCPKCKFSGVFTIDDRRDPDKTYTRIIRWNPKEIKLRTHPVSGRTTYFWDIPAEFSDKIRKGDLFYVSDTPQSILNCITDPNRKEGTVLFEFDADAIYHMKESSLSGLPIKGWGIPPILPNFKLAYYIQVLRRYDEAIALDYIIPFRILYPDYGSSPHQDATVTMALDSFTSRLTQMVKNRRSDPTAVQIAPFKVGYQSLGGEAKTLAPKESLQLATDELLNAVGFPAELYRGSLSIQAFPVALRLFEKTWGALVEGDNDLIEWLLARICRHYMIGSITGKLRSVTLADDLERKALSLQAAAGMDISKGTAYLPFGIDYMEEQRRVVEEQQALQRMQQEAMEESQAQQGLQGASGGGQPPAAQAGATPGDVQEQAKGLAQQLLLQTPETMRRGELIKIKHSNSTLHALVIQEMDNMRQEMSRQGGAQMMQQAQQGGMQVQASARDLPSTMTIGYVIAEQLLDIMPGDMRKIAMAVTRNEPLAREAFHYVYAKQRGWR